MHNFTQPQYVVTYENLLDELNKPLNQVKVVIYWRANKFKTKIEERTFEYSVVMDSEISSWVFTRTNFATASSGGSNVS